MSEEKKARRALPHDAFTECWYVPGETHIVDLIHPDDGLTLHYSDDAAAIRARHPSAQRINCDNAWQAIDAAALARYRADIAEVTEAQFNDALNVLPPVGWTTRGGVESFRICERLWGHLTDIYARMGHRHFKLTDDIRLSADVIAERVRAFAAAHPHGGDADQPHRTNATDMRLAGGMPTLPAAKPGETS